MPTKKTTKKRATNKSTKKPSAKGRKKQPLVHASGERCFWVSNGPVLTNLLDLEAALREMDDALYQYHAGGDQNDFAEWVEWVLSDKTCANGLRKARKPKSAATVVKRRLTVYEY